MTPRVRLRNDLSTISIMDVVLTALLAAAIATALKIYVLGAFEIPSSSMERTLLPGDFIMVSKLAFEIAPIEHGDIVVFDLPDVARTGAHQDALIKRVVGLPGDTVKLTTNTVYVNGSPQPNPPLGATTDLVQAGLLPTKGNNERTVVVPDGYYFVLGDNRANSYDSRFWGCLPEASILGAPLFIYWSHGATLYDTSAHVRWERIFTGIR